MKDRITFCCIFGLFACLCVSLFFNYKQYRDSKEQPISEVVTVVEYKERTVTDPVAKEEKPVGNIPVPVKKVAAKSDTIPSDTLEMVGDTVMIPLTQKIYTDSLYTAFVSGYHQQLDSIRIRTPYVTTTVTKTKTRRWNVGIVAGYGLGVNSRQFEPFLGVGVTYNIFK